MKRRNFFTAAGAAAGAAVAGIASPAVSRGVRQWEMVTSWPRDLPGPGIAARMLAERITALSGGRLQVRLHAAGELVPGPAVFDAVAEGKAELYHAVPAYWGMKSKGILLFGSQPFGLRADEQYGWLLHGGGQALYDRIYARFNLKPFLCGNSGPQWAGWFRKEIESVEDLRGLRFRTTGLAAEMAGKLGVVVREMDPAAMLEGLQSGDLDAGEFLGPWTDSALGFHEIARNYYWPGVGEPSSAEECAINWDAFEALEPTLQQAVAAACKSLYNDVWTEYTTRHASSLRELVTEHGVQVRKLPESVIIAMGNAAGEVMAELREDPDELVRRIAESFLAYRSSVAAYMAYADNGQMNARALDYRY